MEPVVSVVIPVGPAHVRYVPQAVASVRWQTVQPMEVVAVDDTGYGVPIHEWGADRVLWTNKYESPQGPARARNLGLQAARAPFVLFLDADDYLLPGGVEALLRGYAGGDVGYVYGDVYTTIADPKAAPQIGRMPDYDQQGFARYNLHVVTALVPTEAARFVGGFDEEVEGFEDWTLYLRLAIAGICGKRIPQMTMVYRTGLGERAREHGKSGEHAQWLMEQVLSRYRNNKGVVEMATCCGGDAPLQEAARAAVANLPPPSDMILGPGGTVRMEFYGPERGGVTYRSPYTGQSYTFGNNAINRFANVHPDDVGWLQSLMEIRIVPPVAPYAPPPAVEQAVRPDEDAPAIRPSRGRKAPAVEQAVRPDEDAPAIRPSRGRKAPVAEQVARPDEDAPAIRPSRGRKAPVAEQVARPDEDAPAIRPSRGRKAPVAEQVARPDEDAPAIRPSRGRKAPVAEQVARAE